MELSRRSDDEYLLFVRDILEARDFDDLVELEARTMRRASPPGRKFPAGGRGLGGPRKRLSPSQRQFRNRAFPRARPQASPRRVRVRKGGPQGSLRAARARSAAAGVRGGRPRSLPRPRVVRPVWGPRPPNPRPAGAHRITSGAGPNTRWHLPSRMQTEAPALESPPAPVYPRPLPPIPE